MRSSQKRAQTVIIAGMSGTARAFWVMQPGRGEIRDEALNEPAAGEVVVRALYSGISRGTEALVFHGRVPEGEYARMRAPFQSGEFPGPVKYGYANVGIIEQGPVELTGRHIFALYPHQTRYVIGAADVHLLPDAVPPARAVLAANLETAINGIWDAELQPGDRVTVIGAGIVGCLVAWAAVHSGAAAVELIDVNPNRAPVAKRLGARFALPDEAVPGTPIIIHTSGSPAGLQLATRIAGFEATIVEMSWYGRQPVTLALGEAFHSQRLTIRSSQVGTVARSRRAAYDAPRRLALALSMLTDTVLDTLITGESAFDDLPRVMRRLADEPGDTLCHRIRY
jgi:2-desacetyl-2-hydroxyethyl bacteriochlorophyllide A dehydrogenase